MNDFLGNELKVGDEVCYILHGYREFRISKILYFTKQFVVLDAPGNFNKQIRQYPESLIKIIK